MTIQQIIDTNKPYFVNLCKELIEQQREYAKDKGYTGVEVDYAAIDIVEHYFDDIKSITDWTDDFLQYFTDNELENESQVILNAMYEVFKEVAKNSYGY